jgi:hypothetical protein
VTRRWYNVKILAPFAVLWLLAACGAAEQPPFEVRNEFDQLVADFFTPSERGKSAETMAKRKARGGVVAATGQFLGEAFPQGTPVSTITDYFEGIGGTCRTAEGDGHPIICEYCRNRHGARRFYFETFYGKMEILFIVEAFGARASESTEAIPTTRALAYTVAKGGDAHGGHSGPADTPWTCDDARSRLVSRRYDVRHPNLMMRQWVYGQAD